MRIQQLRDLLDYSVTCRLGFAQLYRRLEGEVESPRVGLMLNYFSHQEEDKAQQIKNYIADAPDHILDTWYQDFVFEDEDVVAQAQDATLKATANEDDALELYLEFDNQIIEFFNKASELSRTDEIRETLEELVRVEKTQQQRVVHGSIRMTDM